MSVEGFRGLVNGVPSMLLPAPMLAGQFSLLGLHPTDLVVFVTGEKLYDGTLVGMACERLGHTRYAVLQGGMAGMAGGQAAGGHALARRDPQPVPGKLHG